MHTKHEWRKSEKSLYLPKQQPQMIDVPPLNFITIQGEGRPDTPAFADRIAALYGLAYTIKMLPKKMAEPPVGYFDFTVYPLEGVWSLNEQAIANFGGTINKEDFVYTLMLRQPDFVDKAFYQKMLEQAKQKKQNPLLDQVKFERITEGLCVQMLHMGPYDTEPASFEKMEAFAEQQGLKRLSKMHREIYLSDFRKVPAEKLKTVLRFKAERLG